MKKIDFKGFNGAIIKSYLFDDVKNAQGVVQIIHGMQEYSLRYVDFAKYLNSFGYIVFISDLRGHGANIKEDDIPGHSDNDISIENLEDQKIISEYLKNKYNLPLTILGHSYGSFIAQRYLGTCDIADKVILSGSAYSNTFLNKMGKFISNFISLFNKSSKPAKLVSKLSVGGYGKGYPNGNWLSRDDEVYKKYQEDSLCGQQFPLSFFNSMLKLITTNHKFYDKINKKTPILLIGGSKDPVSSKSKYLKRLFYEFKKRGLNVDLIIYPEGRHEMLNEINKLDVYSDILKFIQK